MDMQIAERLMTADELHTLDISDHIKVELVQGVLVTMPPASIQDSMLASHITFLIGIVSGESASDLQDKVDEYFTYGARLVWAVFPKSKTIHVHSPSHIDILKGDELLTGGDVLPNFSHPVSDIFSVLEAN
jgi:Uma2 family endonuclease